MNENTDEFEVKLDNQFIYSKHKIFVDYNLKSLETPESTKNYAKKALKRVIHDDAEISAVKLKKPSIVSRLFVRMAGKTPQARLYVTTKF
jgi:hypothetical protein